MSVTSTSPTASFSSSSLFLSSALASSPPSSKNFRSWDWGEVMPLAFAQASMLGIRVSIGVGRGAPEFMPTDSQYSKPSGASFHEKPLASAVWKEDTLKSLTSWFRLESAFCFTPSGSSKNHSLIVFIVVVLLFPSS